MNKKRILVIIAIVALILIIYQVFLRKEEQEFEFVEVMRGNISQEVIETGRVQKGNKINLLFKNSGRIENIFVAVGETVKKNDILAKLETQDLKIQLQEAKAALSLAEAQFNKLLAGASEEEIRIAQTKIDNNQISLGVAEQALENTHNDALNVLDDVYLKAYNSHNMVDLIQRTYFTRTDQEGISVKQSKDDIKSALDQIEFYLNQAKNSSNNDDVDLALSYTKSNLSVIFNNLTSVRQNCESITYRSSISSTDKASLDTHRGYINAARTSVTDSSQSIASAKLSVGLAEGQIKLAQEEMSSLIASPRQEDVDLKQSGVDQAQARVQVLENEIQENYLRSPIDGQIAEINKREGELVQSVSQGVVVTLLPSSPYEVEADIYEEDVVKIKTGNEVEISLVAFPHQVFEGSVISIDPAEKIVDGVIYYKVIIALESPPEEIKSGMTADLIIKTLSKENVLIVSDDAIQRKNNQAIVLVLENGEIKEKQVKTGIEGNNNMVEIISGLEEGEKLILQ